MFDSDTWVYELHEGDKLTVASSARPGVYDDYPQLPELDEVVGPLLRAMVEQPEQDNLEDGFLVDRRLFIGPHPARCVAYPITSERTGSTWYVELPHVIVAFEAEHPMGAPLEPTTADRIRAVVSTFEAIDRAAPVT